MKISCTEEAGGCRREVLAINIGSASTIAYCGVCIGVSGEAELKPGVQERWKALVCLARVSCFDIALQICPDFF